MPQYLQSRVILFAAAITIVMAAMPYRVCAATLDRVSQTHAVRIAYRADAPPFSYSDRDGAPAGLMVDLCKAVVQHLSQQLNLPSLSITFVTVTAVDRFEAIEQGKTDLLCEPTSSTLSRRKEVDFSVATFVDGASLLIGPDGPTSLDALAGRSIGVLDGTTTEHELKKSLTDARIDANVIPAKTHAEGLAMLDGGKISAYFGDRAILMALAANSKDPGKLRLADAYLTIETYALALPRGDDDFRLEVDRALSHIYGSGEINSILARTFGASFRPEPTLRALYLLSGLPD